RFEARGVGSELELQPGTWTVGSAEDDGVRFPGLPPRLLELDLAEDRVWVRCRHPCPVGRALLQPGVHRWLLPGERIRLSRRVFLWFEAESEGPSTRALIRSLLGSGQAGVCSAAPTLVCVVGADAGSVFPLVGPAVELGRALECAVRLSDGAVSRRQLQLVEARGRHRVLDLGGRNRVRRNGRWLRSGVLLADGDLLAVGRSLLHYRSGSPEPADIGRTTEVAAGNPEEEPLSASARGPPAPRGAASASGGGRRSS
ncbi:MAG TPA: FHA domain-containing protein, partial [Myxococcaceae bacterium]